MNPLNQLMATSIHSARLTGKRLPRPRRPSLTQEQRREAWKRLRIFRLGDNWCHSMSGRVFLPGTYKWNWCNEMHDRYGED